MKHVILWIKKDLFLTGLVFLATTQLLWFCIAPQGFKDSWSNNPLIAQIIKEHNLVEKKAKLVTISYYFPAFEYFAAIASGTQQPKQELMDGYHFGKPYIFDQYYQKAVDLLPENDSAHFLLGFCKYYEGQTDLAVDNFKKSIDRNPYFFWSYYNLGVIYFKQGEFLASAKVLGQALYLKKVMTLKALYVSPFYRQILRKTSNPSQLLVINLDQGMQDAALLLADCILKAQQYDQALRIFQSMPAGNWNHTLWEQIHQNALKRQSQTNDLDRLLQERIPVRLF